MKVQMKKNSKGSEIKSSEKRINSFFSGVGGFDLAFEKNGFSTSFYCENNDFCRSVLKRHYPSVPNCSDIGDLDPEVIPFAQVWAAGFPCQDLSLARTPHGKRSGLSGSRSGLFFTFLEHLSVHRPEVVLLENVVGLLSSHKGADFKALVSSLTQLGYAVAWRVLNARYFGAPQSRPRVFICAWQGSPEKAVKSLYEDQISTKPKNERRGFVAVSNCKDSGASVSEISFCISATSGRHTGLDWARSYVTYPEKVRRLTPLECERLQGFPDNWTMPDRDYVIPIRGIETSRYHAIGNAVCVPVVSWVANRISSNLDAPTLHSGIEEGELVKENMASLANGFLAPMSMLRELATEATAYKWSAGGIAFKEWVTTASVSSSPVEPITSSFIDIIEKVNVHDRYYLSPNAIQGILRRVDKLGRNLFPPLDATLRKIASGKLNENFVLIEGKDIPMIKQLVNE